MITTQYFYKKKINIFYFNFDALSLLFFLLTSTIFPCCYLLLLQLEKNTNIFLFKCALQFIEILLILTFTTNNLLLFYIFFESILIPMFLLIGF